MAKAGESNEEEIIIYARNVSFYHYPYEPRIG